VVAVAVMRAAPAAAVGGQPPRVSYDYPAQQRMRANIESEKHTTTESHNILPQPLGTSIENIAVKKQGPHTSSGQETGPTHKLRSRNRARTQAPVPWQVRTTIWRMGMVVLMPMAKNRS
jgi:hypothetical protein